MKGFPRVLTSFVWFSSRFLSVQVVTLRSNGPRCNREGFLLPVVCGELRGKMFAPGVEAETLISKRLGLWFVYGRGLIPANQKEKILSQCSCQLPSSCFVLLYPAVKGMSFAEPETMIPASPMVNRSTPNALVSWELHTLQWCKDFKRCTAFLFK